MTIQSSYEVQLDHRALYTDACSKRMLAVAASEEGRLTIVGPAISPSIIELPCSICSLSLHPNASLIAWTAKSDGSLHVADFFGTQVAHITTPQKSTASPIASACAFSTDGDYLWHAFTLTSDQIVVQRIDSTTWQPTGKVALDDPFFESHISFGRISQSSGMSIWVAAGQDGQQVYWAEPAAQGIVTTKQQQLADSGPPIFSHLGNEFLAMGDEDTICRYSYPNVKLLGMSQIFDEREDFEPFLYGGHCYLNHTTAVASLAEGRLFTMDLDRMTRSSLTLTERIRIKLKRPVRTALVEEVFIAGHEPVSSKKIYPTLDDNGMLCSDLTSIERYGDLIITTHQKYPLPPGTWNDILAFHPTWALGT